MFFFPFLTLEQHTTFKESMINRFSNLINHNRSAAKISQVLCSSFNVKNDAMTFCFTWHHYQNDETNHSLEFWASWNCKFLFSSARRFCGAPTLTLLTSEARVDEIVVPAAKIVWIFNAWFFLDRQSPGLMSLVRLTPEELISPEQVGFSVKI